MGCKGANCGPAITLRKFCATTGVVFFWTQMRIGGNSGGFLLSCLKSIRLAGSEGSTVGTISNKSLRPAPVVRKFH